MLKKCLLAGRIRVAGCGVVGKTSGGLLFVASRKFSEFNTMLAPEKMRENGMHSLAPINSIIPKLRIVYDDEDGLPFGAIRPSESFWLVSLGRIYLWDAKLRRLLRSGCEGDGILDLVAYYMIAYHGLDFFSKTCDGNSVDYDDNEHQDKVTGRTARIKLTDFGHARFLGEGVSTLLG